MSLEFHSGIHRLAALDQDIARWDHLLSPNAASTPRLRSAFGYQGPVHETGYPRNDVLSAPDRELRRARVRAGLGIAGGMTAVLYTPTWRDDLVIAEGRPDHAFPADFDQLVQGLPADHVLLLRLHGMVAEGPALAADDRVRDVSDHPDVGELYLAADVLVTDYSSTMFDFAVTGKPIIHFTYDIDHYRDDLRGFYVDLAEIAPGPLLTTSAEVLEALAGTGREPACRAARYARLQETFCTLEDGHATDRVLARFFPPAATGAPHHRSAARSAPQTHGGDEHAHS